MSTSYKQAYIKELKQQIDSKPSKLQEYQSKLNEREIYGNSFFDDFGSPGGGAPLRRNDGTLQTKRRTMLNDNYEELTMNDNKNLNLQNSISNQYNQYLQNYQQQNSNQNYANNIMPQQINSMNYYQRQMSPVQQMNNTYSNMNMNNLNNMNNMGLGNMGMNMNMNNNNNNNNNFFNTMTMRMNNNNNINSTPYRLNATMSMGNINDNYSNNILGINRPHPRSAYGHPSSPIPNNLNMNSNYNLGQLDNGMSNMNMNQDNNLFNLPTREYSMTNVPNNYNNNYNNYSNYNNYNDNQTYPTPSRPANYSPRYRKNMPDTINVSVRNEEEEKSYYPSIVPTERIINQDKLSIQKRMMRDEWLKQIDEKKFREKRAKELEHQKDLEEEEKYNKYIQEQKKIDQLNKQRRQDELDDVNNFNKDMANTKNSLNKDITVDNIENMQRKSNLVRRTPQKGVSRRGANSDIVNEEKSAVNSNINSEQMDIQNNNNNMDPNMQPNMDQNMQPNMDQNMQPNMDPNMQPNMGDMNGMNSMSDVNAMNQMNPNFNNMDNSNSNFMDNSNFQMLRNMNNNIINNQMNNYEQEINRKFASLSRTLDDNIDEQIQKLRGDINSQYIDMSNLLSKLRMDVIEENQLKEEAEKELQYIKDELVKSKMNNLVYESKLNQVLERNAPYNNLHIPFNEVDPLSDNKLNLSNNGPNSNMKSTSAMIFANDMANEGNINRIKELNSLSLAGQNLVGESKFIPIQTNANMNVETGGNSKFGDSYGYGGKSLIGGQSFEGLITGSAGNDGDYKVLEDKGDFAPMYKLLEEIADINQKNNPDNRIRTGRKKLEEDYK